MYLHGSHHVCGCVCWWGWQRKNRVGWRKAWGGSRVTAVLRFQSTLTNRLGGIKCNASYSYVIKQFMCAIQPAKSDIIPTLLHL